MCAVRRISWPDTGLPDWVRLGPAQFGSPSRGGDADWAGLLAQSGNPVSDQSTLVPPSKQLGGSEALTCLYVNLPFFCNKSVQETALSSALELVLVKVRLIN